ncbi:MAG: tetratricopeptide repeat protein, partial [Myxococcota bacterium]
AVSIALLWGFDEPPSVCETGVERVDGVWNAAKQEEVAGVIRTHAGPQAEQLVSLVDDRFREQISRWRRTYRTACEATYVEHTQAPEALSRVFSCLDDRVQELKVLSSRLAEIDRSSVKQIRSGLGLLAPVSLCENQEFLSRSIGAPGSPIERKQIADTERRIVEIRSLHNFSRHREALVAAQSLYDDVSDVGNSFAISIALARLGIAEVKVGRVKASRNHLHEAVRLALESGNRVAAAKAWDQLVFVEADLDSDFETAIQYGKWALALRDYFLDRPGSVAVMHSRLGWALNEIGRTAEAEYHAKQALDLRVEAYGELHPETAYSYFHSGRLELYSGRCVTGIPLFERASRIFEELHGAHSRGFVWATHDKGACLLELGRLDEAAQAFESVRHWYLSERGPEHVMTAFLDRDFARLWLARGDWKQATPYIEIALSTFGSERGPEQIDYAETLGVYGNVLAKSGSEKRAEKAYREAIGTIRGIAGKDSFRQLEALEGLAALLESKGRLSEAAEAYAQSIAIRDAHYGAGHESCIPSRNAYTRLVARADLKR